MSMSKKDFVAIAHILDCIYDPSGTSEYARGTRNTRDTLSRQIADYCAAQSQSFDRARFLKACGVSE